MLIQNADNLAQALQPDRIVNSRLASNGGSNFVANSPNAAIAIDSVVELPQITATQDIPQQHSTPQIKTAVDSINHAMQQLNQKNLEFSLDPNSKEPIVQLVDAETGELILQIPSKVALAIAQSIDQYQHGLLLNQKA